MENEIATLSSNSKAILEGAAKAVNRPEADVHKSRKKRKRRCKEFNQVEEQMDKVYRPDSISKSYVETLTPTSEGTYPGAANAPLRARIN
jgi:hypothetical protein